MKVLIFGPSGAGKTYLATELKKRGLNSIDADAIDDLSSWFYGDEKVAYPNNADEEWLDNHAFLWDRDFLKQFLLKNPDIYIFGVSGNALEMFDLFDKVYYLDVPPDVQNERLQHESRKNPMGDTAYQRENAIAWGNTLRNKARDLGVAFIYATQTPDEIYKQLTHSTD